MVDAERVLQFLVNRVRVRGSIGVYGRSIGGIAATHLSRRFPKIVSVFIGDRTMGDFEEVVRNRYANGGGCMKLIYKVGSCAWKANNCEGSERSKECYKIHCFDENDDVLDVYSSPHHGIAATCSTIDYSTKDWH